MEYAPSGGPPGAYNKVGRPDESGLGFNRLSVEGLVSGEVSRQTSPTGTDGGYEKRQQTYRRSYKACLNCRQRKVKCDLGDISNPSKPPCARCRREGKECTFTDSKRGGVNNVRLGREKRAFSTDPTTATSSAGLGVAPKVARTSSRVENDVISQKELHNTADALEILAHAARSFPKINGAQRAAEKQAAALAAANRSNNAQTRSSNTGASTADEVTPEPKTRLVDTELIAKEKLLTEDEAKQLIKFFFDTLHPFYPFIPEKLHTPESLADVPILLASITTLSSRYYALDSVERDKYVELHNKLWDYCQRLITKTVWAEASTRSIGTVFSFLLFSEWNPRAIHQRWQDYANHDIQPNQGGDGISGLSASRRSDRLSWMLLGSGIRLAQDLGLMETSSKVYLATHLSEIVLALRMGRKSMLSHSLNEPVPENLEFTQYEKAKLGLLQIMSLAHETLYGTRSATRELLRNGSFLTFLALFGPHLDNWEHTYGELLTENSLERESILFDYHYTRLYIYSLALYSNSDPQENKMTSVAQIIPSSRYVAMATDAAKELLAVANRVHAMDMLRRAPVRWIVRIVHATVFLVKSIMLTPTSTLESHRHTLGMIRTISRTLIDSSPDEIHLSSRYGTILLDLSNQLASKLNEEHPDESSIPEEAQPQPQEQPLPQDQQQQQRDMSEGMFEFSRYSFPVEQQPNQPHPQPPQNVQQLNYDQFNTLLSTSSGYATPQQQEGDANQNLLSVLDMDFDFLMEGTEGLGFVEPLMEGIEHHQMLKRQRTDIS
ncbi:hypothetical protein TRICI_004396 [Trichomonascus ciferrii]|uniref:Zn(2)-C6 fungal-type domain-containing protein n=1 Tax=Trichomonascus ciferrii TaxID=44093 RepID=A0A642V136_9ASCO|nr:hypothetical protein TRICI_004396 [Trichomonascus ciferrii]